MSVVTLVSGGLDSSLVAVLAKQEGIQQYPLFIDYGQLSRDREWKACLEVHKGHGLPIPKRMDLSGVGRVISSGLTDLKRHIYNDAFLPGRNLLFLVAGSAYAFQVNAQAVSIGLLNEETHIFPDQTRAFTERAEGTITFSLGRRIRVLTPLMQFNKEDVIRLANRYGITGTYSCHRGLARACGECISCKELLSVK